MTLFLEGVAACSQLCVPQPSQHGQHGRHVNGVCLWVLTGLWAFALCLFLLKNCHRCQNPMSMSSCIVHTIKLLLCACSSKKAGQGSAAALRPHWTNTHAARDEQESSSLGPGLGGTP